MENLTRLPPHTNISSNIENTQYGLNDRLFTNLLLGGKVSFLKCFMFSRRADLAASFQTHSIDYVVYVYTNCFIALDIE